MNARIVFATAVPLVFVLTACDRPLIDGVVLNTQGETLPGVAVHVVEGDFYALSSGVGEYAIAYRPGTVTLEYHKSGYTTGRQVLEIPERQPVRADDVRLWRLPSTAGVFLVENYRYLETTPIEPKQYYLEDGEVLYGTERKPGLQTDDTQPVITVYNMPRYDARLTRLTLTPAKRALTAKDMAEIWAGAGTMQPEIVPVADDATDLLELRLDRPLEHGIYAVHWGALEGSTILDSRIHLFRVGPEEVPEPEDAAEGEEEKPKAE